MRGVVVSVYVRKIGRGGQILAILVRKYKLYDQYNISTMKWLQTLKNVN